MNRFIFNSNFYHDSRFGSDNFSGVLPEVFKALEEAAYGHQHSYEEDVYSEKAIQDFKNVFGENIRVFFVYNGTGANILSLSAFTHSYNAVICAETAHINVDECGAIEKQSGCKLLTVPTFDGKLTTGLIQNHMHGFGEQHHSQPKMISLTQCTELGTVYTPAELKEICDYAHAHRMYVHMTEHVFRMPSPIWDVIPATSPPGSVSMY